MQAAIAGLEAGVVQRALQLRCVLLQHRQRFRLFDRQMRSHLAAAVDIDADIDAAEVGRIEPDFETALAVLDRCGDFEREPAQRHRRVGRRRDAQCRSCGSRRRREAAARLRPSLARLRPMASAGACAVSAPAEWSWTVPAITGVDEGLAAASDFVASVVLSLALGVAVAGCAVAAVGSVVPGVVSELSRCRGPRRRRGRSLGGCGFRRHRCGSGNSGRYCRCGRSGLRFDWRGGCRRLNPGLRRSGCIRGDLSRIRRVGGGVGDDSSRGAGIDLGLRR